MVDRAVCRILNSSKRQTNISAIQIFLEKLRMVIDAYLGNTDRYLLYRRNSSAISTLFYIQAEQHHHTIKK